MGAILYKALIFKEIFYGLLIKGAAGLIVFIETNHVPVTWVYLALAIVASFPVGTYILKEVRKHWFNSTGFMYVGISFLKMLLIPLLIILFFEKDHQHIEAFVIPLIVAYLILLAMDTKWKIKWLFSRKG
jgi:drug/metabolite transporter (DMT)-like permease